MFLHHHYFHTDFKPPVEKANDNGSSIYALPEKTKRGPPTNKNIPIRNIMAQISNMSTNENAGFKSEYHVRFIFLTFCVNHL